MIGSLSAPAKPVAKPSSVFFARPRFLPAIAANAASSIAALAASGVAAALLVACASQSGGERGRANGAAGSSQRGSGVESSVPSAFPKEALTYSVSPATALRPFAERLLPNGLRVLFVDDQALPYVQYSLLVRGGSSQDPKGLSGLANMTADLLDQGTSRHTAPQIAEALARLGTEFNAATEEDYSLASVGSLSTNADALLDLFSEVVMQPAFADAEIARARAQALARIQKRVDDANGFADAAFADYLFGDHPYSRTELGTATAMAEIKKKNIIMNYKRYYRPNNSILAVVGKIGPELRQRVEKVFGAWQPQEVAPPAFPPPPKIEGLSIRLVEKPGIQQAQIRIGQVGIRRQDEDFLALRVANMVLGAPFTSRLMKQIRVKLGLTYSISSAFEARLAEGPFVISTFTKPQTTGKAVEETLKVLREFRDGGVAADEVELAKSYLKGLFPQAIETAERFAQNLMLLRLYGVPDTYLSTYAQAMDKIQVADVNRVIQKHFDPKNLRIVVYASADVLPQLKPLGAVEEKGAAEILR